jgi:hypothetical protein
MTGTKTANYRPFEHTSTKHVYLEKVSEEKSEADVVVDLCSDSFHKACNLSRTLACIKLLLNFVKKLQVLKYYKEMLQILTMCKIPDVSFLRRIHEVISRTESPFLYLWSI